MRALVVRSCGKEACKRGLLTRAAVGACRKPPLAPRPPRCLEGGSQEAEAGREREGRRGIETRTQAGARAHTLTHTHIHTYTASHTHTHAHTHTRTHTHHTHTHTHTHTHSYTQTDCDRRRERAMGFGILRPHAGRDPPPPLPGLRCFSSFFSVFFFRQVKKVVEQATSNQDEEEVRWR